MAPKLKRNARAVGAMDIAEESFHLLRTAPAATLACYYIGALPFVLGFLYFWADMSRGAFAAERVAPAALGVALLFLWMKTWQSIFCRRLKAHAAGEPPPSLRPFFRTASIQAVLQPTGFIVLPVAALAALPLGWAYTFYQNATALGHDKEVTVRGLFRLAAGQSLLWPKQNHLNLAMLTLFGLMVFLNLCIALILIPSLLKTFTGIETAFTLSPYSIANTTFLAVAIALTYLCVDPVIKSLYVLRCYHGLSLKTGEDIRNVFLRSQATVAAGGHAAAARSVLLAVLLVGLTAPASRADAAEAPPEASISGGSPEPSVLPSELDQSIAEVLQRREYLWRLRREASVAPDDRTWLGRFFAEGAAWIQRALEWVRDLVFEAVLWIREGITRLVRRLFGGWPGGVGGESGSVWMQSLKVLAILAVVLALSGIAALVWRALRGRRRSGTTQAQPVLPMPDLTDENVAADQLPEDDWLALARDLMGGGEFRLALRALYLASLAHLAERGLVQITRSKSNREYERELGRRARNLPDVQRAFAENVTLFDRTWYGLHEVSSEGLERFQSNVERIRTC